MTSSSWNKLFSHDVRPYDLEEERGDIDILAEQYLRNMAKITPQIEGSKVDARLQVGQAFATLQQTLLNSMASRDRKRTAVALGSIIATAIHAGHTFNLPLDCVVREMANGGDADQCFLI